MEHRKGVSLKGLKVAYVFINLYYYKSSSNLRYNDENYYCKVVDFESAILV
jgi:hypothetical protein